ncbi:MAG: acetyltransferase [Lautropia sp.]|nr:acetyltransferase [Lautropia sp.]
MQTCFFRRRRIAYGLYGTGGFGREVMPLLQAYVARCAQRDHSAIHDVFYIDLSSRLEPLRGITILSEADFLALDHDEKYFNIAIANSRVREKIACNFLAQGIIPLRLQAEDVVCYDGVSLGEGSILCTRTVLTSDIRIGRFFHGNIFSYVSHDCVLGDFVTFAPNVHCNGTIHIHDHAYIGAGATIRQGTHEKPLVIGEGAIVGMGAVVIRDVPAYTTVIGNPARRLEKKSG